MAIPFWSSCMFAVDGITGLGFHEDGWRNILTKDKTINTVDDMKGVRIIYGINCLIFSQDISPAILMETGKSCNSINRA